MKTGVGDGTGAHTARKFSKSGYKVAMIARTSSRLIMLEKKIQDSKAYICDVANIEKPHDICKQVKLDLGAPEILIFNAVKGNFEMLLDGNPEWLE